MAIERSRPVNEDDSSDKDRTSKKKRRAEALGGFAVVPEKIRDRPEKPADPIDIWEKLKITKRRAGVSEPAKPLTELLGGIGATQAAETKEAGADAAEAPMETLSPTEKKVVEREIVAIRRTAAAEQPPAEPEDSEEMANPLSPGRAVEIFHDKILHESLTADQAFAETAHSLQSDVTEESAPVANTEILWPITPGVAGEVFHIPHGEDTPPAASASSHHAERPARDTASHHQRHTPFVPYAKAAGPRGTGYYSLDKLSRKGGGPGKEYIPLRDELRLETIPGAVVGYLLGRRRGRVNAEKKLLPVKKKLEKQVEEVQEDIAAKELQIQKMAREAREHEKREHGPNLQAQRRREEQLRKQPEETRPAAQSSVEASRSVAPEANQLHGKKPPSEKIGHVLVAANIAPESPRQAAQLEQHKESKKAIPKTLGAHEKRAATMSRNELLRLSEEITVDNTTLRHIYDTHLVSESGLRRIVHEHMRGGDIKKMLQREILEHEAIFERDPYLRQHPDSLEEERPDAEQRGGSATDDIGVSRGDTQADQDNRAKASASAESSGITDRERAGGQSGQHKLLDTAFIGIIVTLLILIALLVMNRG